MEVLVDVEQTMVRLTKIAVPWARVLEYERVLRSVDVPERVD